jgi:hypothetical protein
MLLTNALILTGVIIFILLLRIAYKSLFKSLEKKTCDFKLSKAKYRKENDKYYSKFSITLKDKNQFFVDFPLAFRFYGDTRFQARIKIRYEALKTGRGKEEIIDKVIQFETKTIECKRRITDIIIGEIEIEIEIKPYYGNPIIEFEILKNQYCILSKPIKKIIKFPKKLL